MKKQLTIADQFRQQAAKAAPPEFETVELVAPSGFTYTFRKPDLHSHMFGLGRIPTTPAVSDQWERDGLKVEKGDAEMSEGDKARFGLYMVAVRDRVLELSITPKLVFDNADEANGELSVKVIADQYPQDLAFLFEWVQSGGTKATSFANFPDVPGGPQPGPIAGPNRSQRRAAAKSGRGNK